MPGREAEDLPILTAALREGCPWLVTFNLRHYRPSHTGVKVLRPGGLLLRVRSLLAGLGSRPALSALDSPQSEFR